MNVQAYDYSNIQNYKFEGIDRTVSTIIDNNETRTVVVESEGFVTKSVYDKLNNKVTIYQNNNKTKSTELIKKFEFNLDDLNKKVINSDITTYANYDQRYVSEYHTGYSYYCAYYPVEFKYDFSLSIPDDSLATGKTASNSKIYDKASTFKTQLINADDHTRRAVGAFAGLSNAVGMANAVLAVIQAYNDTNPQTVFDAVVALIECVPGLGKIVSMADIASNASLAAALLYNCRQDFNSIKNLI